MYKKTLDNNKRKRANFFFRCSLSPPLLVIRPNPFLHLFSSSDYHSVVLRSNEEGSFLLGPPQHLPRRWETVRIYEVDTFGIETVFSFPAHHQPVGRETNKELEQLGQVLRKKREKKLREKMRPRADIGRVSWNPQNLLSSSVLLLLPQSIPFLHIPSFLIYKPSRLFFFFFCAPF